jgi:macrolide transport system ATP-binding/permease protein
MTRWRAFWIRLVGMWRRNVRDDESSAEMESHLEMHIHDNLRPGMTPEEARRDVLIQLRGMEQAKQGHWRRPWKHSVAALGRMCALARVCCAKMSS